MPSLIDTADFIAGLAQPDVAIDATWCVHTRHRRATCTACADACPRGAITINGIDAVLDASLCVGCGACITACPTQAITSASPSREGLLRHIEALAAYDDLPNRVAFCCSQVLGSHDADDPQIIALPCLAMVDATLITHARCLGLQVLLAEGGCEQCAHRRGGEAVDHACAEATRIAELWQLPGSMVRRTVDVEEGDIPAAGIDRRGIFGRLAQDAKGAGLKAASNALSQHNAATQKRTLAQLLIGEDGTLRTRVPERNETLLNDLYECQGPEPNKSKAPWETTLFGTVTINREDCRMCGLCSYFCPTGALTFTGEPPKPQRLGVKPEPPNTNDTYHEFRASDCVACRLCQDVCTTRALTLTRSVNASSIFELEPERLD